MNKQQAMSLMTLISDLYSIINAPDLTAVTAADPEIVFSKPVSVPDPKL